MKDLTLWKKILLSLQFNDSISHNIFLFILFLLTVIWISFIYMRVVARISNRYLYDVSTKNGAYTGYDFQYNYTFSGR